MRMSKGDQMRDEMVRLAVARKRNIPRAWIGHCVDWFGFDGKHYTAHVEAIRCGIAVLRYFVTTHSGERIYTTAYVGMTTWQDRVNQPKATA